MELKPGRLKAEIARLEAFPYVYRWSRCGRKGQRCAVTARGKMNSARVEFPDGFIMITSRNALARALKDMEE